MEILKIILLTGLIGKDCVIFAIKLPMVALKPELNNEKHSFALLAKNLFKESLSIWNKTQNIVLGVVLIFREYEIAMVN